MEVEGSPATEVDPEAADGGLPALHHGGAAARVHPARILGKRGTLGNDVETGEKGEARIEGLGHDLGRASDAPQLEREQGTQGVACGDHAAKSPCLGGKPSHYSVQWGSRLVAVGEQITRIRASAA